MDNLGEISKLGTCDVFVLNITIPSIRPPICQDRGLQEFVGYDYEMHQQ